MSESDTEMDTNSGIKISRFHGRRGEDYALWRHRLRAACRVKGVWGVVDTSTESSVTTDLTDAERVRIDSRTRAKREKASGIIISALGDAPLRVVMDVDDDPARMLQLLDGRYASNRTVSRIAVQTQLFRMSYNGQNMSTYVDQFTSLFSQLERMGTDAAIPDSHKAPMLLASIDPKCPLESTAAALRTKDIGELTWDYVATTLIDEYNAKESSTSGSGSSHKPRNRRKKNKQGGSGSGNRVDNNRNDQYDSDSDIDSTVRAFAVALKSGKFDVPDRNKTYHCNFCDKSGHTEDRCWLNPDNPNNKIPAKLQQRFSSKANAVVTNSSSAKGTGSKKSTKVEIVGATILMSNQNIVDVDKTTVLPPKDHRTYNDSGATCHCFHCESYFVPGSLVPCQREVMLADKNSVTATHMGDVILPFENANIRLKHVLYIPNLGYNLVSTGRLADNGIESKFGRCDVRLTLESNNFYVGLGSRDTESGLYMMPQPENHESKSQALVTSHSSKASETELWHRRLAHINAKDLVKLHEHVDDVPELVQMEEVCRACRLGKAHKLPFPGHFRHTKAVGDMVHSDIMGPLQVSYPDGFRYVSTFLDDHSRYLMIGCMSRRSMLGDVFEQISAKFRDIGGANFENVDFKFTGVSKLHSDGAKEYVALQKDLGGVGKDSMNKSFSPPYTPELNGIAERVNRTLVEAALALLIQADLPSCLWPFALKHVTYVRNRVPHSTTGATPYAIVTGQTPSFKHVRVFGCTAYVLRVPRGSKFESRSLEGVYLETLEHGIYKVLVTGDDGTPRIMESRHVTFDESKFPGAPGLEEYMDDEVSSDEDLTSESDESDSEDEDALPIDGLDDDDDDDVGISDEPPIPHQPDSISSSSYSSDDDDSSEEVGLNPSSHEPNESNPAEQQSRYPRRNRRKPTQWYMASTVQLSNTVNLTTGDEPTLREAMSATPEERDLWQSAIDDEFESLESKNTWIPDDSPNAQPLPTFPILRVKRNSDGSVERFKARVVAGGNFQTYGENYKETYAPVVSFSLVRIFLYLVLCLNMFVAQLDVKTAFLNGDLTEPIWVMSPRGIPGRKSRCYRLLKAIYGLKQAHLAWHTKLCGDLLNMRFEELPSAPCVFRRKCKSTIDSFILVYVDDLLILAASVTERDAIVEELKALYELRVSDEVEMFLGVQLRWKLDSKGHPITLSMSQPLYAESVLRRFGLQDSKPAVTPMVESFYSGLAAETDKSIVSVERYQQMVGSLLYLALRTRLDILAAVLILARFQTSPTAYCHRAIKRVLRYVRGTSGYGVHYNSGSTELHTYVDADYAGDTLDRKSTSGFMVKLGDATCIWGSKKQDAVAVSTCESEYYAMSLAAKETVWVIRVLTEAGFGPDDPVRIKSDNQSAIKWATGERCPSGRAKHIDVRVHFVRNLVKENKIEIEYVPTELNDADMLTKPLGPKILGGIIDRIGIGVGGALEEEC